MGGWEAWEVDVGWMEGVRGREEGRWMCGMLRRSRVRRSREWSRTSRLPSSRASPPSCWCAFASPELSCGAVRVAGSAEREHAHTGQWHARHQPSAALPLRRVPTFELVELGMAQGQAQFDDWMDSVVSEMGSLMPPTYSAFSTVYASS